LTAPRPGRARHRHWARQPVRGGRRPKGRDAARRDPRGFPAVPRSCGRGYRLLLTLRAYFRWDDPSLAQRGLCDSGSPERSPLADDHRAIHRPRA
jgi:hypothetical protein